MDATGRGHGGGFEVMLRRFEPSDAVAVRHLIRRTIDACYPPAYPPRAVDFFKRFHSDEAILRRAGDGHVVVAEYGAEIVATGALVDGEITGVFVAPEHQGDGLGRLVMDELEATAVLGRQGSVHLSVSLPSRGFYEHRGYRIAEACSIDVGDGQRLDYWEATKVLADGAEPKTPALTVVPLGASYRGFADALMREHFGSERVVSRGRLHDTRELEGLAALRCGEPAGFLSYAILGDECEIVALVSAIRWRGVARVLVDALDALACEQGAQRLVLVTTNDNVTAQAVYSALGFSLTAVNEGAIARARAIKPEIPFVGEGGVPIADELEYERLLRGRESR